MMAQLKVIEHASTQNGSCEIPPKLPLGMYCVLHVLEHVARHNLMLFHGVMRPTSFAHCERVVFRYECLPFIFTLFKANTTETTTEVARPKATLWWRPQAATFVYWILIR